MMPGTMPVVSGGYRAYAAHFDGANDWLSRAALSGLADGTDGTISFWLRRSAVSGTSESLFNIRSGTSSRLVFELAASGVLFGVSVDATSTQVWGISGGTALGSGQWYHVAACWNAASSELFLDASSEGTNVPTGANIEYSAADVYIGARPTIGAVKFFGDLAEVWFAPTYIDLTVAANMQKFRLSNGKPAALGSSGQVPTGSAPSVYLRGPAATFATNRGSGGNYTVNGALTDAATSPTD